MGKKCTKKLKKCLRLSDEELKFQIENDNNVALGNIIELYGDKIYATAYSITKSHTDADDVFQDVLLSIYKNVNQLKEIKALSSWIYRITVNNANMKLRASRKNKDLVERVGCKSIDMTIDGPIENSQSAMTQLLNQELKMLVEEAVSDLPPKYKSVILLNDFNDFSIRKTSDILNISIPAVKSRLHRARKKLKRKLGLYFRETAN
jgi:RNA polymerase sigma-70 factor (ECF subfamily)